MLSAIGCLMEPYHDRTMRQALEAIDRHLDGKPGKPPKGLQLFPITKGEAGG